MFSFPLYSDTTLRRKVLLPIVVQVYEFHEKLEKLKKALNHHKQESNKKGCVGKFTERSLSHTQHWHIQNAVKHLRRDLLRTWLSTSVSS